MLAGIVVVNPRIAVFCAVATVLVTGGCGPGASSDPSGPAESAHSENRPNVLLIVADALRADHLSVYGYERKTSPTLDEVAGDALVFQNATSQAPLTIPSVLQLMTGRYLQTSAIGPKDVTLAEVLSEQGYRTVAIVDNPVIEVRPTHLDRGFEQFHLNAVLDKRLRFQHLKTKMPAAVITRRALRWWQENEGDQPFFVWLHYFDTHDPYFPPFADGLPFVDEHASSTWTGDVRNTYLMQKQMPEKRLNRDDILRMIDLYDAEIFYMDRSWADVFGYLERKGLYDDTLIIVTSDHGESFGDHGNWLHGNSLYQSEVHVPLVVKLPGRGNKPQVIEDPVEVVDILPTICAQLDIDCPEGLLGSDLVADRREFAYVLWRDWVVVRDRSYKLISNEKTGAVQLFNLRDDPGEEFDLWAEEPDAVARLEQAKESWLASLPAPYRDAADRSSEQAEKLEALGYLK